MSSADAGPPDDSGPDIPEKSWTNPFPEGTPLHKLFGKRVRQNRDIVFIVDDFNAGRGTGKSIASLNLANGMDQHGTITRANATMEPEALRNMYSELPKRTGLVLDEGEVGASNRDAMSNVNKALREIMSMGRVEEKYVVINTPLRQFIDKDLQKLADVWISMTKKGEGIVHFYEWEGYSETLMTPKKGRIQFNDIPADHELRDVYNYLTKEKRKKIGGVDGGGFVPKDEHEDELQAARSDARLEMRDEVIQSLFDHPELSERVTQSLVAEAVGLSQASISNIINR